MRESRRYHLYHLTSPLFECKFIHWDVAEDDAHSPTQVLSLNPAAEYQRDTAFSWVEKFEVIYTLSGACA